MAKGNNNKEKAPPKPPANESEEKVLNYLKDSNRPFSVNDLVTNIPDKLSKGVITKALENLVNTGEVTEKLNAKQKYYFYSQDKIPLDDAKLKEMEEKIKVNEVELNRLNGEINVSEQKMKGLGEHKPIDDLEEQLTALKSLVSDLAKRSADLTVKCQNVDPAAQNALKRKRETYVGEWKRRKRMANEMFGQISANINKPKKAFMEEIGFETDESVEAKIPSL